MAAAAPIEKLIIVLLQEFVTLKTVVADELQ
jgi:hypothetical protein